VVTFKPHFPNHMIKDLLESEFMGLCASVRAGGGRTLFLHPTVRESQALKSQLLSLERQDALSFSEKVSDAP